MLGFLYVVGLEKPWYSLWMKTAAANTVFFYRSLLQSCWQALAGWLLPWARAGRNLSPWLPAATTTSASLNDLPPLLHTGTSQQQMCDLCSVLHQVNGAVMYFKRTKNRLCFCISDVWIRGQRGHHKLFYLWQEKTCSATWMVMSHCSPLWYRSSKSAPRPEAGSRTASGVKWRWIMRKGRRERVFQRKAVSVQ